MEVSFVDDMGLADVFDDLVRVETALWNALEARLHTADPTLTMGRFEVLRAVAATPGCRVQDVAVRLNVTVGGVSKLVDRLESSGHLRRRPHPTDRRSSLLHPTDAGLALLGRSRSLVAEELGARIGAVLTPAALAYLATSLRTLRQTHVTDPGATR